MSIGPRIGDFRLGREVGRGGMGVIYLAEQISSSRRVALKVKLGAESDQSATDQLFLREATLLASLQHPNLPRVYNIGRHVDRFYYAMEILRGPSLKDVLDDLRDGPQPGGPAEHVPGLILRVDKSQPYGPYPLHLHFRLCEMIADAVDAMGYIHSRQIVHLDLTPNNILVNYDGRMMLIDFGLARHLEDPVVFQTRSRIGTPRFMAPEQITQDRHLLNQQTDVYGFGATLYELFVLQPAILPGNLDDIFRRIKTGEIIPPTKFYPEFPKDLEAVLFKALALNPADRYPTARELADDLFRYLDGEPVQAPPPRRNGFLKFGFGKIGQ